MRRAAGALLVGGTLLIPLSLCAQKKDHNDAFVRGPQGEARLMQEVRHQLVMLPYYTIFDDLAFQVTGSTVTLLGDVTNPVLKSDAENVIKRLEGVTQVINRINVLPLSDMDWQIRRAEFRAIYGSPQIGDRYGNRALPQQSALVWLSDETLTVGTSAEPLAYYTVKVNRRGELTAVTEPRRKPTQYSARQPWP